MPAPRLEADAAAALRPEAAAEAAALHPLVVAAAGSTSGRGEAAQHLPEAEAALHLHMGTCTKLRQRRQLATYETPRGGIPGGGAPAPHWPWPAHGGGAPNGGGMPPDQ